MTNAEKLQNLKSKFLVDFNVWFDNPDMMKVKIADKSLKDTTFTITANDGGFNVDSDKGSEVFHDEAEVLKYLHGYVQK